MPNNNTGFNRIIPTPQNIIPTNQALRLLKRDKIYSVCLVGPIGETLLFAAGFLCKEALHKFGVRLEINETPDEESIILCSNYNLLKDRYLVTDSVKVFDNDLGRQQGYIIQINAEQPVILCAASEQGCLYAVSTLLQLFHIQDNVITLDSQIIADYPDFKYRGNCWLIMAECGMWSYDRGDGIDNYRKRIVEKLDMCVRYKVNMLLFDAMGWATDRFPGYADLMREINREARLRGIHLMYVGYGSGYGAAGRGFYRGQVFQNRNSYPDGEEYPCLGGVGDGVASMLGRYSGTCVTNTELMRLKCEEFRRFVYEVEPGAMYIHNLDNDRVSKEMWLKRCPECRKRWPSDDLDSDIGMAGAYAEFYDTLAECIKSVKKPGYDADRDCVLYMISPGYMYYEHSDEDWQNALAYWAAVSRLMKYKHNVSFMFREQFFNHDSNTLRCAQMREALDTYGHGHEFGIVYFYGADGFHNDQLHLPTPSLHSIMKGTDAVVTACGNAFQEPLQLLNAEYLWNSEGSAFYNMKDMPTDYSEFLKVYKDMMEGKLRPPELYGSDGFLGVACRKLYGETAGPIMAKMFALCGEHNEYPVPFVANTEIGAGGFNPFEQIAYWNKLTKNDIAETRDKFQKVHNITAQARDILNDLLKMLSVNDSARCEINWYAESLKISEIYTRHCRDYVDIYEQLLAHFELNENLDNTQQQICDLRQDVSETRKLIESLELTAIDYLGGALAGRDSTLTFLESNLEEMAESIIQDKRFVKTHEEPTPWW